MKQWMFRHATRQAPPRAARNYPLGTVLTGADGDIWVTRPLTNGSSRWQRHFYQPDSRYPTAETAFHPEDLNHLFNEESQTPAFQWLTLLRHAPFRCTDNEDVNQQQLFALAQRIFRAGHDVRDPAVRRSLRSLLPLTPSEIQFITQVSNTLRLNSQPLSSGQKSS